MGAGQSMLQIFARARDGGELSVRRAFTRGKGITEEEPHVEPATEGQRKAIGPKKKPTIEAPMSPQKLIENEPVEVEREIPRRTQSTGGTS